MIALIGAVLAASLLGSMHCAGMCGAFLAFAVGAGECDAREQKHRARERARLQAAYHLGRLTTYTAMGATAGALGAALDLGGSLVGVQRVAAVLAGAMMVGFGVIAVMRLRGVHLPKAPVPGVLQNLLRAGHRAAFNMPPARRALTIGLLTTLLPCGWLYAFAITAAGTASPLWGAVTMAVFWVGTMPVLVALGTGVQALAGPLRARVPMATALALVGVGLFTIFGRVTMPPLASPASAQAATAAAAFDDTALRAEIERINSLDAGEMPCCTSHAD